LNEVDCRPSVVCEEVLPGTYISTLIAIWTRDHWIQIKPSEKPWSQPFIYRVELIEIWTYLLSSVPLPPIAWWIWWYVLIPSTLQDHLRVLSPIAHAKYCKKCLTNHLFGKVLHWAVVTLHIHIPKHDTDVCNHYLCHFLEMSSKPFGVKKLTVFVKIVFFSVGLTHQSRQWPTRPWPTDPELTGLTLGQSTSVTRDAPH
jgi:hypothetical protein